MDSEQIPKPPRLDYAREDEQHGGWRRLPTTIAIAALATVASLLVAMWVIAMANGHVRLLIEYYNAQPEFRGNHGPWRHAVLRGIYDYALLLTLFGVIPLAFLGAAVEGRRRAAAVLALAMILLVVGLAHFELFD